MGWQMTTQIIPQFCESVDRHEGDVIRTEAGSLQEVLEDLLAAPAVATPTPFDELALTEMDVTTDPTPREVKDAAMGITTGELGIADYGSVVLSSTDDGTELISLYPDHHVAILDASDLVADMPAAFEELDAAVRAGRDDLVIATGPSATADMGTLVYGAHGPRDVTVVLVEDR